MRLRTEQRPFALRLLAIGVIGVATGAPPDLPPASATGCIDYESHLAVRARVDLAGEPRAVAVSGELAFAASGAAGVSILDLSGPGAPALLAVLDTPGQAQAVDLEDGVLAVADGSAGLALVEIDDPATPLLVGQLPLVGAARHVDLSGSHAYVADAQAGLVIVDVSEPEAPTRIATLPTVELASGVSVVGTIAYLADGLGGLLVVDVADPAAPTEIGRLPLPGRSYGLAPAGDHVFLAADQVGLLAVDVTDPAAPRLASLTPLPGRAQRLAVAGTHCFVAARLADLAILDVSDPAAPRLAGSVDCPAGSWDVAVQDGRALIAAATSGLLDVDVTHPVSPASLGELNPAGEETAIAVQGRLACVVSDTPLRLAVVDLTLPEAPVLLGNTVRAGSGRAVAMSGELAFVADASWGIRVVDLGDPTRPVIRSGLALPSVEASGVAAAGTLAYVADGPMGLVAVDATHPEQPVLVGWADTPGNAQGVALSGDLAYVADGEAGLQIMSLAEPRTPVRLGGISTGGQGLAVAGLGDHAVLADGDGGLCLIDAAEPASPLVADRLILPGPARDVSVAGDRAYVVTGDHGMAVVALDEPGTLTHAGTMGGLDHAVAVVAGEEVLVADRQRGVVVVPAHCGSSPVVLDRFEATPDARGGVRLRWSTARERLHAGFHLYRAEWSRTPCDRRLTREPIPAPGPYAFHDRTAEPGAEYLYRLGAIDRQGGETLHGRLRLHVPAQGAGSSGPGTGIARLALSPNPCTGPVEVHSGTSACPACSTRRTALRDTLTALAIARMPWPFWRNRKIAVRVSRSSILLLRIDEHGECMKRQLRLTPGGAHLSLLMVGDALENAGAQLATRTPAESGNALELSRQRSGFRVRWWWCRLFVCLQVKVRVVDDVLPPLGIAARALSGTYERVHHKEHSQRLEGSRASSKYRTGDAGTQGPSGPRGVGRCGRSDRADRAQGAKAAPVRGLRRTEAGARSAPGAALAPRAPVGDPGVPGLPAGPGAMRAVRGAGGGDPLGAGQEPADLGLGRGACDLGAAARLGRGGGAVRRLVAHGGDRRGESRPLGPRASGGGGRPLHRGRRDQPPEASHLPHAGLRPGREAVAVQHRGSGRRRAPALLRALGPGADGPDPGDLLRHVGTLRRRDPGGGSPGSGGLRQVPPHPPPARGREQCPQGGGAGAEEDASRAACWHPLPVAEEPLQSHPRRTRTAAIPGTVEPQDQPRVPAQGGLPEALGVSHQGLGEALPRPVVLVGHA